ncbi:MAG: NUDIX hydrolase [Armatimonadetes bacterium]|nr:NUDIX hydrolase [Armatimonadota bacterium]MCX7968045.1 NUDIX hydrolase [Armatimonadota bacterium]MDW8143161.1 NUDIX hydrolase [Armatimonadota bacterium]
MRELIETMLESERIYDGRLIGLRRDKVKLPNGRTSTREVVVHPGAVAIVPLLSDGRVILVRQYRYAVGKILMEIPAGTLHPNETAEDCALRELREEIGYTAGQLEHLASIYLAPGYSTELIHVFLATNLEPASGDMDEDEFVEPVAIPLEDAISQIGEGKIQDAKTVAALLLVWQKRKADSEP